MDKNLLLFLENKTDALNDRIALGMKSTLGTKELSFNGVGILSKRFAGHLINLGIDKGDNVAILSESMPEWGAVLFGSVIAGTAVVPLDIKLTIFEMETILKDSTPRVLAVSSQYLNKAVELKEKVSSIEHIILIDDNGANGAFPSLYTIPQGDVKFRHRSLNKTALIVYTSGSTGQPKGVEITFKNVLAQIEAIDKCFGEHLGPGDALLSILPLNHLFELTVGLLSFLNMGTSIYYSKSLKPKDVFAIIQEKNVTFMIVVPAFLKLLKAFIEQEVTQKSKYAKLSFRISYAIAKVLNFKWAKKLLFKRIRKKFGKRFKGFFSGGAPLDIEVANFFETVGIDIYEGYGLSEASPVVSVNTPKHRRLGSVGKPLFNVQVKTDESTGELMVRGDSVMKGYFKMPELTAETITKDGWLKTGDIARIDKDDFVWITGRIKNLIVLSGGKKVFPEEVETALFGSPMFKELCVFPYKHATGQKEGTEDVGVVVVPSEKLLNKASDKSEIEKLARAEIKELSQKISSYKRPTVVIVTDDALPRTPLNKIKRKDVKEIYSEK